MPSFETETLLLQWSSALKLARLSRRETQALAAERAGVSKATYMRMESADPVLLAGVSVGAFIEALVAYGYRDTLFTVCSQPDTEGQILRQNAVLKRGLSYKRPTA